MLLETTGQIKMLRNSNMVEITDDQLKALQNVLLGILDDIDLYCSENSIEYALGGGSVLGAIRHKGFIPWDDDADVDIPRAGYNQFIKGFAKRFDGKYVVESPETTPWVGLPFARVRLSGTVLRTHEDSTFGDQWCGVYIDITPIENAYGSKIARWFHGVECMAYGLFDSCRRYYRDRGFYLHLADSNKSLLRTIKVKALIGKILSFRSMAQWNTKTVDVYSKCHDDNSRYVVVPAGRGHFFGEIYLRSEFARTRKADFEGRRFNVPIEAEKYLTHHYGDYKRIPKPDEIEHHVYMAFDLGDNASKNHEG